jgi:Zn-dependent M28 family amino/carboxypeptidase
MLELGQRHYGAELRSTAIEQLAEALGRHVDDVHQQRFTARERESGKEHALVNIIGRRNPTATPRVLLGSHYDTRLWAEEDADTTRRGQPIGGANDGTSGVAVLLELLRVISATPDLRDLGIDVVLFDGEEFGRPGSNDYCKGSVYFVRHLEALYPSAPPAAAILVDMVGDRKLKIRRERSSNAILSRRLSDVVWRHGQVVAPEVFVDEGVGQIIDDQSAFHAAGIPAVLIIDLEYEHWHTHQDTLDKISAASMEVVGKTLKAALPGIFALDSRSRQGASKP